MEIKDYIETRIKKHKTAAESLRATTSDLINVPKYAIPMLQRYAPATVASTIQEQIDALIGKQVALDQLFAAEITQHIKNARHETLPDAVRNRETPADYQAQISNALAFLQAAGGQLTDDEAFDILKPFFNDWEQMHAFERVIMHNFERTSPELGAFGLRSRFPKALGGILDIADTHTRLFDEAEKLAKSLFTSRGTYLHAVYVSGYEIKGEYIADGYEQLAAQDRIIEVAQNIDRLGTNGAFMADPAILRGDAAVDVPAPGAESDNMFIWLN